MLALLLLAAADKPRVAVFPLAGTAPAEQRQAVGFALRAKLDRDGHYDPIDGPTMDDLAAGKTPSPATPPAELVAIAKPESPAVLIWGAVDGDVDSPAGATVRLKVLDTRSAGGPTAVDQPLHHPTDLRFAVEHVLQALSGVGPFAHPVEDAVTDDPAAAALWKSNPNLVPDGDFAHSGPWTALLRADQYVAPIRDAMPDNDRVEILRHPGEHGGLTHVLAMTLSKGVAESNGLACLSGPIPIRADRRYRLGFRYRSGGPHLHVFVKGYAPGTDLAGQPNQAQCYELQVPPSGPTRGTWQTVTADLNPQNPAGPPPTTLRVDLYAYLAAGTVMFADVQLKDVGGATHHAADDALRPATRP